MLKVVVSKQLQMLLKKGLSKFAEDWREKIVWHMTPTGRRTKIKVKNLSPKEQAFYRPNEIHNSLSIKSIQSDIYNFQKNEDPKAFRSLHNNFMPMITNVIKKVIGNRKISKEDERDIKQQANMIFVRAINNADSDNDGIIKYLQTTLLRQLQSKAREVIVLSVNIL